MGCNMKEAFSSLNASLQQSPTLSTLLAFVQERQNDTLGVLTHWNLLIASICITRSLVTGIFYMFAKCGSGCQAG